MNGQDLRASFDRGAQRFVAGDVMRFVVSGEQVLLTRLVAAVVAQAYPDAPLRTVVETSGESPDGRVRVELEGTGRWICIAACIGRPQVLARAISEGASAVVNVDSSDEDFYMAMEALVANGRTYVPLTLMRWMAGELTGGLPPTQVSPVQMVRLTAREREVLELVAEGQTNTEIAAELCISTNTVRSHLHSLCVKLEATSRTKLVAHARQLGLLRDGELVVVGRRSA